MLKANHIVNTNDISLCINDILLFRLIYIYPDHYYMHYRNHNDKLKIARGSKAQLIAKAKSLIR